MCNLVPGLALMSLLSRTAMQKKVRDVWVLWFLVVGLVLVGVFVLVLLCKKISKELVSRH